MFFKYLIIASIPAYFVACSSSVEEPESVKSSAPRVTEQLPYSIAGNDTIWTVVDQMPIFSGGDSALLGYLARNTVYPEAAVKSGTEGKCFIRFCVTEEGTVTNVSILKGVSQELDSEALRVVSSLPAFEYPALKNGKPAAVWYVVPIQFRLN